MKFDIWVCFENMYRKFKFYSNLTRITDTLREDQYTFMIESRWVLVRMKNISDKICRENQNTYFIFCKFSCKSCRLWDNVEKYCRYSQATDVNVTRRMRFTCWITKATDTHSEYVTVIALPLHQWLRALASILRYNCITVL